MSDPLVPYPQEHPVSPPDNIPEKSPHDNPAGVVSHQDQFNTPQESMGPVDRLPGGLSQLLRRTPSPPANKPLPQTVLASSIDSISANLHGGVTINLATIFGKRLELTVRKVCSITYVQEIVERSLTQIAVRQMAVGLFERPMPADEWEIYLCEVAIPLIRETSADWIGNPSNGTTNPINQFFFGEHGVFNGPLDQGSVLRRLADQKEERIVPLLTKYNGPAMVVVFLV